MYQIKKFGYGGGEFFLFSTETHNAIIDSGFPCCGEDNAKELKKHIQKLDYIILTHSHYDHAGGSPYFKRAFPEAKVVSSEYAAYVFTRPGAKKLISELTHSAAETLGIGEYADLIEELNTDIALKPGDKISLGEISLVAIESIGHTKCCLSYFSPEAKLLIAAETLGVYLTDDLISPCCLVGYDVTIDSIKRAASLGAEAILFPHMKLLAGKEKCDKFFRQSLKCHEETKKLLCEKQKDGYSFDELVALLKDIFYTDEAKKIQPEKAFYENAGHIINCMLK